MEKIATDQNLEELIASAPVVLVDFWAPWCGPCRSLAPMVGEIAAEYEGRVCVVKCNVDECEDAADKFGIRGVPTLMYFKNGEMVKRTNFTPKAEIASSLDALL